MTANAFFLTEDFLLDTRYAKLLYHDHASRMPIIDYHNHLPPEDIASDRRFSNLTEIWLKGDHYKWRAMRALGVPERLITGDAPDEEKFRAWAACVPQTVRNPLFHWTHMELSDPFGIRTYLNPATADGIYAECNAKLSGDGFSTKGLLSHFNVEMICTTDDPCDSLEHHRKAAAQGSTLKVLPGFRPDRALNIADRPAFMAYMARLEAASGIRVTDLASLLQALSRRIAHFHEHGCRIADHGLTAMPFPAALDKGELREFSEFLRNDDAAPYSCPEKFTGAVLNKLCLMYHEKGWVQQFHLGAIRNNNSRRFGTLGPDSGHDSVGDHLQAMSLSRFLDSLDKEDRLARTIIYNLNPSFNEVFASMAGNFNDGSVRGKIQFGSGWWFMDQLDGMERQLNALSSIGMISTFVGMLTDSRSFLSFPRHEYFRRLLCNIFGSEMERGLLPRDEQWIGGVIQDICYRNAKTYFDLAN